ncbi:hypothetical protein ACJMK2_033696, partial [Sinanodonta woodiana]
QWFNTAVIACNGTREVHEESYQYPLIQTKYWLAVVYIILMALAIFLGTFGNMIILVVSIGAKTINRVGRSFIINLAVADFCISTMVDPLCIFGECRNIIWLIFY